MATIRISGTYIYQGGPALPIIPYAFNTKRTIANKVEWPVTDFGFGADSVEICPALTKEALIKLGNQLLEMASAID